MVTKQIRHIFRIAYIPIHSYCLFQTRYGLLILPLYVLAYYEDIFSYIYSTSKVLFKYVKSVTVYQKGNAIFQHYVPCFMEITTDQHL